MKIKPVFLAKVVVFAAAFFAVLSIVPNWKIVFGYGNGGGGASCGDTAPGSAPYLLSAIPLGNGRIQLHWSDAVNPATYYLVTFGTKPGQQLYGNPNVGPQGTTTYTVGSLPGGRRFYFKVRAGNGCTPGAYSNEVSAVSNGPAAGGVPVGFAPGVLGAHTQVTPAPTPSGFVLGATPAPTTIPTFTPTGSAASCGFFCTLGNFFGHLFGH